MRSARRLAFLGAVALCGSALAATEGITIPKGTSVDLTLLDGLSTRTAKVGQTFRAKLAPPVDVDDQPALPEGTIVVGKVDLVKSIRKGALTGVIGVKFTSIQLPGAKEQSIEGKLTSLRQDDRKQLVERAAMVSTGRKIDTVLIGRSTAGRASTLVGDDLAQGYSDSGLGAAEVEIAAGTQITMELADELTVPSAARRAAAHPDVRRIHSSHATVAATQKALIEKEYYRGEVDGQLGPLTGATRQAIIRFQLAHGQLPTGDLDMETLRLLGVKPPARY